MRVQIVAAATMMMLIACGGSGTSPENSNNGSVSTSNSSSIGSSQASRSSVLYVDASGNCAGRLPCFTTLHAAVADSFFSQIETSATGRIIGAKRPNDPPDQIVVMPGKYRSLRAGDWVLLLGLPGEEFPPATWKLRLESEQGAALTTISGEGTGPCIEITDYIDLTIKGFTITGCTRVHNDIFNEKYAIYLNSWSHARVHIEENVFVDNTITALAIIPYYGGYVDTEIVISRNKISKNLAGIELEGFGSTPKPGNVANITIANNLIYRNGTADPYSGIGIKLSGTLGVDNDLRLNILHNTVASNVGGIAITDAQKTVVQNNVVYGNKIDISGGTVYTTNNLVGEIAYSRNLNNSVGDPLFVDSAAGNFELTMGSSAVDTGLAITNSEITKDYFLRTRPLDGDRDGISKPDIGAIEKSP
jgi:parallel beta-helix repeat protein